MPNSLDYSRPFTLVEKSPQMRITSFVFFTTRAGETHGEQVAFQCFAEDSWGMHVMRRPIFSSTGGLLLPYPD